MSNHYTHLTGGFHQSHLTCKHVLLISLLYYLLNQFLHGMTNNPTTAALPLPTPAAAALAAARSARLPAVPQAPQLAKEPYYLFLNGPSRCHLGFKPLCGGCLHYPGKLNSRPGHKPLIYQGILIIVS